MTQKIVPNVDHELFMSHDQVLQRIHRQAEEIYRNLGSRIEGATAVIMLNGGAWYAHELLSVPEMQMLRLRVETIRVSRYGDALSGNERVRITADPEMHLTGLPVLLLDDIFDQGISLDAAVNWCGGQNASAIYSATMCYKDVARPMGLKVPNFMGFRVPNKFVFGCGMDYQGRYRHLAAIYNLLKSS